MRNVSECDAQSDGTTVSAVAQHDAEKDHQDDSASAYILPNCNVPPPSTFDPVSSFVKNAVLEQHVKGDGNHPYSDSYRALIDTFRSKEDRTMLHMVLLSLRTCGNGEIMNLLASTNSHARLIHLIFRLNPFNLPEKKGDTPGKGTMDFEVADALFHLMMALVSANTVFLVPILNSLWNMIALEETEPRITRRVHAAIATASRLCPTTRTELFPVIVSLAPARFRPETHIKWYYSQTLHVLKYVPTMEAQIIDLMVEKALEMDVEIKISDRGEAEIDADDEEAIFDMDLDDALVENAEKPKDTTTTVDEMANKLDTLLYLLFDHIEQMSNSDPAEACARYKILESIFESAILVTHKSKFVQFLILHICGLEIRTLEKTQAPGIAEEDFEPLYRVYATRLIEVVLDPHRALSTRQTSACYLASFISRSVYVNAETCCESVCALLRWAEAYMTSVKQVHAVDVRDQCNEHSLFYTVSQAAFYIMCFRGDKIVKFYRDAIDPSQPSEFDLPEIDISAGRWETLCGHALQPLRYCLESVRDEFIEVAGIFELMNKTVLDTLRRGLEHCKKSKRKKKRVNAIATAATLEKERLSGGVGGLGKGTNPLDSFFPFDPFLLYRSYSFIEPYYNHWVGSIVHRLEDYDDAWDDSENIAVDAEQSGGENDGNDDMSQGGDDRSEHSVEPMSMGSHFASPEVKLTQAREVWTDNFKRSRTHSIASENGSW